MQTLYTLSKIYNDRIPIGGKSHNLGFLKKVMRESQILADGVSGNGKTETYKLETIENAYARWTAAFGNVARQVRRPANAGDGDDIVELRKTKIKREIDQLERDIAKRDITIEKLKDHLVDTQEVTDFLSSRKAVELAILRRILFVEMPIQIPGLTIAKAREKAVFYYNQIVEAYGSAEDLWKETYDLEASADLENKLESIIKKIEDANKM